MAPFYFFLHFSSRLKLSVTIIPLSSFKRGSHVICNKLCLLYKFGYTTKLNVPSTPVPLIKINPIEDFTIIPALSIRLSLSVRM